MQWNDGPEAGFTTGTPWIKVDERYPEINVESQLADPYSILNHYKKLIALRKSVDVITNGRYERLDEGHPQVFAYARISTSETLVVVSNFSARQAVFVLPEAFADVSLKGSAYELLASNTQTTPLLQREIELSPYASYMWVIR